jgi:flagellar protein FlaJ
MGGVVTLSGLVFMGTLDPVGLLVGLIFFFISFYFIIFYPKLTLKKRVRTLEKNLLFALRHMLIEIKSGVPLFDSLVGISVGYEELSDEFQKIVRNINAGKSQIESLNEASERNPSLYFRRALWQIVNAIKAGSDIGNTLEVITNDLSDKQINEIKSYGQELNPWTMMYMIVAVIAPSLGVTFLIILSSFSGITIPNMIFPMILLGLFLFQIFFIGFVKSKRPSVTV